MLKLDPKPRPKTLGFSMTSVWPIVYIISYPSTDFGPPYPTMLSITSDILEVSIFGSTGLKINFLV